MSQQYKISQSEDEVSQNYSSRPHSKQNINQSHNSSDYESVFHKYSRQNYQAEPIHHLTKIQNQNYEQDNQSKSESSQVVQLKKLQKNEFQNKQTNQKRNQQNSNTQNVYQQNVIHPTQSKITIRNQQNVQRTQSNLTENIKRQNLVSQQQVLRHTITNESFSNNNINSLKNINIQSGQMRISLPSNVQQNQNLDRRIIVTPNVQHQKISMTHQQPYTVHHGHSIQGQYNHVQMANPFFVNKQQNNIQRYNNNSMQIQNVRPRDFIQGQTQLQKSQIVYKDRREVHQNRLVQNQRRNLHQEPRYLVENQNYRRSSSGSPNVKFNYNLTQSTVNLQQNVKPIFQNIVSNINTQKTIPVLNQQTKVKNFTPQRQVELPVRTQVSKIETIANSINWEQKYFSIYSRLQHFSQTFQIIVSDFASFERNIQNFDDQKILKSTISKHKKLSQKINQLQQQISTIIHEEKPSSTPTLGIVQQKYQKLLQNYAKLHQQHNRMKVMFEKKINQSIKTLENENDSLKQKLNKISQAQKTSQSNQQFAQQFAEMNQQIMQMKKYISSLQQSKTQSQTQLVNSQITQLKQIILRKNQEIQHLSNIINTSNTEMHQQVPESHHQLSKLSQELNLILQEKQSIAENLALSYQKNIFLQSEIERLSQQSLNNSETIRAKNLQIQKLKEFQNNSQSLNNRSENSNINLTKLQERIKQLQIINSKMQQELIQKDRSKTEIVNVSQTQRFKQYEHLIQKTTESITQIQFENSKLFQKNKLLNDQIERLNQKIRKLQSKELSENKPTQIINQQSKQPSLSTSIAQYQFTINLLRNQVARRQEEIQRQAKLFDQRVRDLTDQLKIAYNDREHTHKKYLDKVDSLQKEIDKKEAKIRQLRDKIVQYEQQKKINSFAVNTQNRDISQSDNLKYQSNQIIKLNAQIQKLRRSQSQKQRDIKKYCEEIEILEKQISQYRQQNTTLKRQTNDFSNASFELTTLNEVLSRKNMQILELKNKLFQKEAFLIQNSNLKKDNERLSTQNLKMSTQIQSLNQSQILLSKNIRQIQSNKMFPLNQKIQNLQNEYNLLLEVNTRKDQQISKLRQNNNLLTTNVQQLEEQQNRLNHQWKNYQKDMIRQKQQFSIEAQKLSKKVNEYQKIVLERSVLQHKLVESQRNLNKYKFDYQKTEQSLKQQKLKVKNLESENQDFSSQIQSLNEKIQQSQKRFNELSKKTKKTIEELAQKNKQLQSQKAKIEKGKILELQNSIKHKDNKIWKLQKQLEEMHERYDEFAQENYDEQKIFTLQQKVKQYQARLFAQNLGKIGVKAPDYDSKQIFEKKIIYELKEENDRLREFINGRSSRPTKGKTSRRSDLQVVQEDHDQQMQEVQKRLVDFNIKLEQLIGGGQTGQLNVQHQKSKISKLSQSPMKKSKSPVKNFKYSNINIAQNQVYQVRQMKIRYIQLQKYCNNLEAQILSNQKVVKRGSENILIEQLTYHKQKNRQLEERVDQLLVMNKELKENLERLLKGGSHSNSNTYYVEQINQLKIQISSFETKIKKLIDQNRILKSQLSQMQGSSLNDKSFQFQSKISELTRKNNQFTYLNTSLSKQIEGLKYELKVKNEEVMSLKSSMQLSSSKQTSLLSDHRQKIDDYQMEITRLTNKAKISQSQIQRLNEAIKKKQSEGSDEINRWKTKVSQLQEELTRTRQLMENQQSGYNNMKAQISKLTSQIRSLQFQIQSLSQTNNQITKKLNDSENRNRELQSQLNDLNNQVRSRKASQSQWQLQNQQYQIQITKLKNQVAFLNAQILRLTQDYKKKQLSYESQIEILQNKASQFQYESISAKKSSGNWENARQQYQSDIIRYKNQLAFLQAEIQRLSQEFGQKQHNYEAQISMFRTKISSLEYQNNSFKANSLNWQSSKEKYESSIAKLSNQVTILNSQIQRLKSTSSGYVSQRQIFEDQILRYKNQLAFLQAQIQRLTAQFKQKQQTYQIELSKVRSRLSQIEYQNSSIKNSTSSWQKSQQEYETIIAQLRNQVNILNAQLQRVTQKYQSSNTSYQSSLIEIQRLSALINQLQLQLNSSNSSSLQVQSLRNQIILLGSQLKVSQQETQSLILQIHQIQYKVQLIRSIYIQVDTLVQEQQLRTNEDFLLIKQRIYEQINKGLTICGQIFE